MNIQAMMKQAQKLQSDMMKAKKEIDETTFEVTKSFVTVKAKGNKKIESINKPFILDGYPRTLNQAEMLNKLFDELDINDYEVIYLDIELEEALKRALGRLTCECGATYNIYNEELKPKKENVCDKCGKSLIKRNDDNEESFRNRFATFLKNNEPIKDFYESKNKLHIVNTNISNDEITDIIKDILND